MSQELFEALERHDLKTLADALSGGADPNKGHSAAVEWTPLKSAVDEINEGGTTDAIVLLLRHGANPNGSGTEGDSTPLIVAALNRQLEAVRILLAAGANPNVRDDEGDSPLHLAVLHNDLLMTSVLLAAGAVESVHESATLFATTPLGLAVHNMNPQMVELLLSYGANPDIVDADHTTAYERLPPRDKENTRHWDAVKSLITPPQ